MPGTATGADRTRVITITGTNLTTSNIDLRGTHSTSSNTEQADVTFTNRQVHDGGTRVTVTATFAPTTTQHNRHIAARVNTPSNGAWVHSPTAVTVQVTATTNPTITSVAIGGTNTIAGTATGTARQRTITVTGTGLTAENVEVRGTSTTGVSLQSDVTVGTVVISNNGTTATVTLTFGTVATQQVRRVQARIRGSGDTGWVVAPTNVTVQATAGGGTPAHPIRHVISATGSVTASQVTVSTEGQAAPWERIAITVPNTNQAFTIQIQLAPNRPITQAHLGAGMTHSYNQTTGVITITFSGGSNWTVGGSLNY
jgi:hypothetical protein